VPEQEYLPSSLPPYDPEQGDEDSPPWADLPPVSSQGRHQARPEDEETAAPRRVPGGRAMRAAARRRRRWFIMLGVVVVLAGGVTAAVLLTGGGPSPASVTPNALITTFQPGELQRVPNACDSVPAATVAQYLPGKVKVAAPLPVNGSLESACNWTVDKAPAYRLLDLDMLAYAPSGLASGDGSATFAAIDAYAGTLQSLRSPARKSFEPRATVSTLTGLGDEAFSATQVFYVGGAVTDVATVVIRFHNVIVTVTLDGLQHSNRGDYGPVSLSQLSSAAQAFAAAAEASLH
jgi:hypothetical protein